MSWRTCCCGARWSGRALDRREALAAEWSAELHQVRSGAGPVGQLRFAVSLAPCRMPDGAGDDPPIARWAAAVRGLRPLVLLAAAPGWR
jgi:hypothetical protein